MFVEFVGCVVCYGYFGVLRIWFVCFVNLVFIVCCFWLFTYVLAGIAVWVVCDTISVGDLVCVLRYRGFRGLGLRVV